MKYRFFYHYNKKEKMATVHFRGKCHICHPSKLHVYAPAHGKENKRQPYFVMQGWAEHVRVENDSITIGAP